MVRKEFKITITTREYNSSVTLNIMKLLEAFSDNDFISFYVEKQDG